ncbi:signal peptidase I [Gammaproteobacteria bacterium]|nr:signal peptidase I [Gammaproteobacteria bacterium]
MKASSLTILKENKTFLFFIILIFCFKSAIADWNEVPTGSMKPTIIEGDRILVNKIAYDLHVPFTHYSLLKFSDPARGDIIIFDSEASNLRLVKRVVGIPGDRVEMRDNILYVNGSRLDYETISSTTSTIDKTENLLGVNHVVRVSMMNSRRSSFDQVEVPEGYYLALGDNRDNSADSRVIGFIPRTEIIGRSKKVVMSLNYDNYYLPRSERFFHSL